MYKCTQRAINVACASLQTGFEDFSLFRGGSWNATVAKKERLLHISIPSIFRTLTANKDRSTLRYLEWYVAVAPRTASLPCLHRRRPAITRQRVIVTVSVCVLASCVFRQYIHTRMFIKHPCRSIGVLWCMTVACPHFTASSGPGNANYNQRSRLEPERIIAPLWRSVFVWERVCVCVMWSRETTAVIKDGCQMLHADIQTRDRSRCRSHGKYR